MEARSGVTLRLDSLDALFSPPSFGEFGGSGDLPSGIERLVTQLKTASSPDPQVTLVVAHGRPDPDVRERLSSAIQRYAALRSEELELRRTALRREGVVSLLYCAPIVGALLLTSVLVTGSGINREWRTAINGLLLILVWIGLWYPLDTLFWYGRPLTQELRAVRRLQAANVTVWSADTEA